MKRILCIVTAVLLAVVLCCSAAFASENTYYLEEMNADIALPSWEDYYYLYPNMPADSEDLTYLEMTPEEINAILIPNGILFDALYYDASHEIAVQVNDTDMEFDYSQLDKAERFAIITASTMELEALGYTVHTMEWVEGENDIWLVTEFSLPDGGGWAYQYHTARGGKTLLFTASSAAGAELTDEIRQVTAGMALGTVFHGTGSVIDEPSPSPSEPSSEPDTPTPGPIEGEKTEFPEFDFTRILTGALVGFGAGVVVVAVIIVIIAVKGRRR